MKIFFVEKSSVIKNKWFFYMHLKIRTIWDFHVIISISLRILSTKDSKLFSLQYILFSREHSLHSNVTSLYREFFFNSFINCSHDHHAMWWQKLCRLALSIALGYIKSWHFKLGIIMRRSHKIMNNFLFLQM